MATTKVAVTRDRETLREIDRWVQGGRLPNRSRTVQAAVAEMLAQRRHRRLRLIEELARIALQQERVLAEDGFSGGATTEG